MLLGTSTYDESVGDFRADDSKDAVEDDREVFEEIRLSGRVVAGKGDQQQRNGRSDHAGVLK